MARSLPNDMGDISLPLNLEVVVLERFDQLLESGELFYHPSVPDYTEHNGFKVCDETETFPPMG
jgi:hypothetical protein